MTKKYDVSTWVEQLQAKGRYTFSRIEMESETNLTSPSAMAALRRMREHGRLASPRRGLYVIVPPEYRASGSPPANWFIDDFMRHLGQPYYVGLLTAASIHGAAHQQPMIFQVMTDRPTRKARVGKVTIRFSMSRRIGRMLVTTVQTETGTMRVATPETTAFDLVRHSSGAGHLGNVATVLSELAERMDTKALVKTADLMNRPDVQRLGYLLEIAGWNNLADALAGWLAGKRPRSVPLQPGRPTDVKVTNRWHIQPNVDLETDL